jgi:membrane protease YdiL (CAAX protease family)
MKPWGRLSTFGLGFIALMVGQFAGLMTLTWWYGVGVGKMPDFSGDGVAVALVIIVSTPVQLALLAAFAKLAGYSTADYLGLKLPRRSEVIVGVAAVAIFIVVGDGLSLLLGKSVVTPFQNDISRTAANAGGLSLLLLWLAVIVITPIGEETLFRGFLFRGWLRSPHDTWPVIVIVALLWALIHVQYDWYIVAQIFVSGLMLGWMRWASGSTLLTILLHGLINLEGMIETHVGLKWLT